MIENISWGNIFFFDFRNIDVRSRKLLKNSLVYFIYYSSNVTKKSKECNTLLMFQNMKCHKKL